MVDCASWEGGTRETFWTLFMGQLGWGDVWGVLEGCRPGCSGLCLEPGMAGRGSRVSPDNKVHLARNLRTWD